MFQRSRSDLASVFVLGLSICSLPSRAQVSAPSPKTAAINANVAFLQQAYDYQNSGYQSLDVNQIFQLTTADYHLSETTGVTTVRIPMIQRTYRFLLSVAKVNGSLTRTVRIDKIDLTPTRAVVTQTTKLWESIPDPDPTKTDTTTKGFGPTVYQDTWVRTMTGWAEQASVQVK